MKDKFKTAADIEDYATEVDEKLAAITETLRVTRVENTELKENLETAVADSAAIIENMKSLTIAAKAKGSWKEQDTPIAACYGIGTFVRHCAEARFGNKGALNKLGEMGSRMVLGDQTTKEVMLPGSEEKAGLSASPLTGDDSIGSYNGSYTLPVQYNSEVLRVALDNSAMMGRVRSVPVPAITAYWPTTVDELAFTKLTNQNTDKTEDTLTFGQLTLTTEIYAAFIAIVEEYDEDSLVAIGILVRDMFGEAWGKKFDTLCLSDSTYGAMFTSGILSQVMEVGDSAFSNLDIDDLNDMVPNLTTSAKRAGIEYFMHITNFDTIESEKDADGSYVLRTPAEGAPRRVKGIEVVTTDGMPALADSAPSTAFIALGNPRHIINGTRVPFEFRVYDQTQSNMESGQVFLRVRVRSAFALSNASNWVKLVTNA